MSEETLAIGDDACHGEAAYAFDELPLMHHVHHHHGHHHDNDVENDQEGATPRTNSNEEGTMRAEEKNSREVDASIVPVR